MTSPGRLLWACRRGRRLRSAGRDWTDRICQWLALRQHDENDEEHSRHCIGDIPSARAGSRKQGRVGGSVSINIDYLWSASRTDAMNERPVRVRRQRDCRGKQMVSATRNHSGLHIAKGQDITFPATSRRRRSQHGYRLAACSSHTTAELD